MVNFHGWYSPFSFSQLFIGTRIFRSIRFFRSTATSAARHSATGKATQTHVAGFPVLVRAHAAGKSRTAKRSNETMSE